MAGRELRVFKIGPQGGRQVRRRRLCTYKPVYTVLHELGLSDAQLAALEDAGVIGDAMAAP